MERLRSGQYCSIECKSEAKQKEDQLALESLTLFGQRVRNAQEKPKEKPKAAKAQAAKVVEPPDPAWGDPVEQPGPGYRDTPIRALGFPKWTAPPTVAKKKSIEDYRPGSRVPDEVMMEQERLLLASAMWMAYEGENPDTVDGYRSDFRAMVVAPEVAIARRKGVLPAAGLCAVEAPRWRVAATAEFTGQESESIAIEAALPELSVAVEPADLSYLLEEEEDEPIAAPAPPPPPTPPSTPARRPRVDAQRIASTFPAMMQAGLVRVEPGFATAVLELRPIAEPAPRYSALLPLESNATPAIPVCRAELRVSVREGTLGGMKPACSAPVHAVRRVDLKDELPPVEARIPLLGIRTMAATRHKPDIRIRLRYLPMPHFHVPGPAADWSQ